MASSVFEYGTENQSPFQIVSRREIVSLLSGIAERNEMVTLVYQGGTEIMLTRIIAVDDKKNRVYLDCSQNAAMNDVVVHSTDIVIETSLDKVRVFFNAQHVNACDYISEPALCIDIPVSIVRLQRREFFRVNIPLDRLIDCNLPLDGGIYHLELVDISCGGVAMMDDRHLLSTAPGETYKKCSIDLGDYGQVETGLVVRNFQDISFPNGKSNRRLGCQFIDTPPSMMTIVQRYIMHLERERNARLSAMK